MATQAGSEVYSSGRRERAMVEVPQRLLSFDEVAVRFSKGEWDLLDSAQRALYKVTMLENLKMVTSLGTGPAAFLEKDERAVGRVGHRAGEEGEQEEEQQQQPEEEQGQDVNNLFIRSSDLQFVMALLQELTERMTALEDEVKEMKRYLDLSEE